MVKRTRKTKILIALIALVFLVLTSTIQVNICTFPVNSLNPDTFNVHGYQRCFGHVTDFYANSNINSVIIYDNGTVSPSILDSLGMVYDNNVLNFTVGLWVISRYYTTPLIVCWLPGVFWEFHNDVLTYSVSNTYIVNYVFNQTDGKTYTYIVAVGC